MWKFFWNRICDLLFKGEEDDFYVPKYAKVYTQEEIEEMFACS